MSYYECLRVRDSFSYDEESGSAIYDMAVWRTMSKRAMPRQELKPYVCLSRECPDSEMAFYGDIREWMAHMDDVHGGIWWTRYVCTGGDEDYTWYCDIGHDDPILFLSEARWRDHVRDPACHPARRTVPSHEKLDVFSSQMRHVTPSRAPFVCLFCQKVPDEIRAFVEDEGKLNRRSTDLRNVLISHIGHHLRVLFLDVIEDQDSDSEV